MMAGARTIRKEALIDSGTPSPNPWDLSLSARMDGLHSKYWTEDRAPQGCDPSAVSRAGMARGGGCGGRPNTRTKTPPSISLFKANNGHDNGVHFMDQGEFRLLLSEDAVLKYYRSLPVVSHIVGRYVLNIVVKCFVGRN